MMVDNGQQSRLRDLKAAATINTGAYPNPQNQLSNNITGSS